MDEEGVPHAFGEEASMVPAEELGVWESEQGGRAQHTGSALPGQHSHQPSDERDAKKLKQCLKNSNRE